MYFPTEYGLGSEICMDIQFPSCDTQGRIFLKSLLIVTIPSNWDDPPSSPIKYRPPFKWVKVQMKERTHKPMVATAKPIKTHPHLRSKHKYVEEVSKA